MAKPSGLPIWNSGGLNNVEPSAGRKSDGFATGGDTPGSGELNWWMEKAYRWIAWIDSKVDSSDEWTHESAKTRTLIIPAQDFGAPERYDGDGLIYGGLDLPAPGSMPAGLAGIAQTSAASARGMCVVRVPAGSILTSARVLITNNEGTTLTLTRYLTHVDYNAGGALARTQLLTGTTTTIPSTAGANWTSLGAVGGTVAPADGWTEFYFDLPAGGGGSALQIFHALRIEYTHTLVTPVR